MSEVTTGELIAQLPYALGFYPSAETIVVVSDATTRRLWDFPPDHSPVEVTTAIADLCPDTHAVRVTPMVYASQVGFGAEMDANDLATVLATTFPHVDTPVVVSPDGWRHAIDCADDCCPGPDLHPAVLPADLAHEAATRWPTPLGSRTDLIDHFASDPLTRTLLAAERTRAAHQQRAAIILDRDPQRWRHTATDQVWAHLTRPSGSRVAAARSLLQLQDTLVADAVVVRLVHEPNQLRADVALATLRDLSRAAADDLATAALSVWAHAAATRGDTPRALAAIHRAQKLTPRHHPTVVLRRLLIDGVDPTTLAAVHLPEAALLATPTGITPAVVSTNGGTDGPTPLPPTAGPPPAPPHRPIR